MSFTVIETIEKALRIIGVLDSAQPLQSRDRTTALEALNSMAHHWQTQYGHLWLQGYGIILCEKDKQIYELGTGGDRFIKRSDLYCPTLSSAAASTDTVITVTGATGFNTDDVIGIYLDDGTFHWTTIDSLSGADITLTDAMPSAAASGNQVYAYTSVESRPLKIDFATYAVDINGSEIPLIKQGRNQYFEQPQKNTSGNVTQFYFQPTRGLAQLSVWPTSDTNLGVLRVSYVEPFIELVNNDDVLNFPDEWELAVNYGLATALMSEYGVPNDIQAAIQAKMDRYLADNLAFDNENADLMIELDRQ